MFKPHTKKIEQIYKQKSSQVEFLDTKVFIDKTQIYIDWANVFFWQDKLNWHIDARRLRQFLSSFDQIQSCKIYQGYFQNDKNRIAELDEWEKWGYVVRKKPVKEIRIPINATSHELESTDTLEKVCNRALIRELPIKSVKIFNSELRELNAKGLLELTTHKCNFDVEMASDIRLDVVQENDIESIVIWSGDSDFVDTVDSLIQDKKRVSIFSTRGRVSHELRHSKAFIYDIKNIKNFICWNKERDS